MQKFQTARNLGQKTLLALALPLVATIVIFADNLRAVTVNVTPPKSLVAEAVNAWQDEGVDETLSAHYVQLNDQNRLVGTVTAIEEGGTGKTIPVPNLRVKLVRRSQEITNNLTDSQGNFVTDVVEPGTYTLCISGDEGFLAYGVQVIDNADAGGDEVEFPDLDDSAANSKLTPARKINYRLVQDEPTEITAAVIPPTHNALKQIINGVPGDVGSGGQVSGGTRINVEKSVVAGGFQVSLSADGKLVGRIAPLTSEEDVPIRLQEMNVYLIENDEILAQVVADEDGNFTFNDVEPAVYGFAAAGRDGFAALSFEATKPKEDLNSSTDRRGVFQNASNNSTQDGSDSLNVAICPPEDIPFLRREINGLGDDGLAMADGMLPAMDPMMAPGGGMPMGGFGPGGGFGGPGGGPGGGFGDFGGLIEAGLAAWVLSEAFNNRNNNANVVQPPIILPPTQLPPPTSPFFATPTVSTSGTTGTDSTTDPIGGEGEFEGEGGTGF